MILRSGYDILWHLTADKAEGLEYFVAALPSELGDDREWRGLRGEVGGTPWCQQWHGTHHHTMWSRSFWTLLRKGYIEAFACFIRGDVLYRPSDAGRRWLDKETRRRSRLTAI